MDGNMETHQEPQNCILYNICGVDSEYSCVPMILGAQVVLSIYTIKDVLCFTVAIANPIYISGPVVLNNSSRLIIQGEQISPYFRLSSLPDIRDSGSSESPKPFRHPNPGSHQFGGELENLGFWESNFNFGLQESRKYSVFYWNIRYIQLIRLISLSLNHPNPHSPLYLSTNIRALIDPRSFSLSRHSCPAMSNG